MQAMYPIQDVRMQRKSQARSANATTRRRGLPWWLADWAVLGLLVLIVGCESQQSVPMDIREKLKSDNPAVRYRAVSALSTNESRLSILLLIGALTDTNRAIRIEAAET